MKDFKFKINGTEYTASVEEKDDNMVQVTVNGNAYNVEVEHEAPAAPMTRPAAVAAPAASAPVTAASAKISAPLPGNITKILVSVGQKVQKGDVVMTMEAMKMENNITAEADGTVKAIVAQVGQSVNQGDVLVELEGAAAPAASPAAPAPAPKAAPKAEEPKAAPAPTAKPAAGAKTVNAPLPGTITAVKVANGQAVKKGDVLLVMEAMKMANDITAECDGTVKNVFVQQGASVNVGDALVEIE